MPSVARTVYLLPAAPEPTSPGISATQNGLAWSPKAPLDTLDYTLDCSAFLADAGGDTINTSTVTIGITPSDLTSASPTLTTTALTWVFSGGTALDTPIQYQVAVKFMTTAGLIVDRIITLPVEIL